MFICFGLLALSACFFWEGYFNFHVASVLGVAERGCGGGRGEPEKAVTGKETEATICKNTERSWGKVLLSAIGGFAKQKGCSSSPSHLNKPTEP